ncbi:MAG: hypothetical protein EXS50_02900 [Candidatus Taylorbacteria bacterium]|nr:hypothetical protein [Candidatus Taylorbacteria bacterium]
MKKYIPIFLIILSIVIAYIYLLPEYNKIQAQRLESLQYDVVIEKAADLKKLRAELSNKFATFSQDDTDRLNKMMPKNVDYARLILDISGVASKYAIEMKDIKTTDVAVPDETNTKTVNKAYKTSTISFGFQTSYEGMILFAKDLEQSLRLVDVVSILLAPTESTFPIYNYSIVLQTYWLNSKI